MKKKKILVTGGSGFFGYELVKELSKKNEVKVLDNNIRGNFDKFKGLKNIKTIECDITDQRAFKKLSKVDEVYHLAFINGTENFYNHPEKVLDVGVKGIINIIEFVKLKKIKNFVMFSSSEVYGTPTKVPTNEKEMLKIEDIFNPRFSYSAGKIISESITINFLRNLDIKYKIIRPHNIFGENMGFKHVIPQIILKMFNSTNEFQKSRAKIKIQGNGKETRAFCYIKDAVKQTIFISDKIKENGIFNVGFNRETKIVDLIKEIDKILRIRTTIKSSKVRKGGTLRRCPDQRKLFKYKKFNNNFIHGLKKTVNWYKEYYSRNDIKNDMRNGLFR